MISISPPFWSLSYSVQSFILDSFIPYPILSTFYSFLWDALCYMHYLITTLCSCEFSIYWNTHHLFCPLSFTACFTWPPYYLASPFSTLTPANLWACLTHSFAISLWLFFTQPQKALSSNLVYSSSLLIHNPSYISLSDNSSEHLLQFQHVLHLWVDIHTILVLLKELY